MSTTLDLRGCHSSCKWKLSARANEIDSQESKIWWQNVQFSYREYLSRIYEITLCAHWNLWMVRRFFFVALWGDSIALTDNISSCSSNCVSTKKTATDCFCFCSNAVLAANKFLVSVIEFTPGSQKNSVRAYN